MAAAAGLRRVTFATFFAAFDLAFLPCLAFAFVAAGGAFASPSDLGSTLALARGLLASALGAVSVLPFEAALRAFFGFGVTSKFSNSISDAAAPPASESLSLALRPEARLLSGFAFEPAPSDFNAALLRARLGFTRAVSPISSLSPIVCTISTSAWSGLPTSPRRPSNVSAIVRSSTANSNGLSR